MRNPIIRTAIAFIVAVLVTYVLGAIFVSQGNLARIEGLGLDVTMGIRFEAAIHDVANMTGIYLAVIVLALLIGLLVARGILHFVPHLRLVGYTSAGFVALIVPHILVEALFSVSGIAPTRFLPGLLLQGVAGALGGLAFHWVSAQRTDAGSDTSTAAAA